MGIPTNHVDWDRDIYDRYEYETLPPSWVVVDGGHEPDDATRGGAGPGKRRAATAPRPSRDTRPKNFTKSDKMGGLR